MRNREIFLESKNPGPLMGKTYATLKLPQSKGISITSFELAIRCSKKMAELNGGKPEDYFDPKKINYY